MMINKKILIILFQIHLNFNQDKNVKLNQFYKKNFFKHNLKYKENNIC